MEKAGTQPGAGSRLEEDSLPDAGAEGVADRRRHWATCLRLQGPLATQRGVVGPRGRGCLHGEDLAAGIGRRGQPVAMVVARGRWFGSLAATSADRGCMNWPHMSACLRWGLASGRGAWRPWGLRHRTMPIAGSWHCIHWRDGRWCDGWRCQIPYAK